ncbi:FliA/WhiG family RNA polymerase sigma factor [Acanthopleuribacter pedis]|uniref:FliA/WhiG family RNA polymerase sigma factor n=1 Tax=Acanthopleuribacter pedis TaxID=442870 RepID=A0A8J7QRG5_9BACT|nr:FliA/WhiG family RNA polymerase sigma factor [Acanthopleuribacter pedis]MBO1322928.1 FliA/WhiG family RNA polymerase sigma factor [Acanthopleuribacter pedis]
MNMPQAGMEVKTMDHEARQGQIEDYIPLVKYLAHRISMKLPNHVEIDDLVNSGIIGLIDAIEKFDPSRGIKFKTYAEFRIRGAIFDGLRSLDWVPRSVRKQKKMVEQSYAQLEQQLGRHATDEELSKELGVGLDEFYKILDNLKGVSLGKFVELNNNDSQANGEGDSVIAFIPDRSTDDPYHKFQKHELTEILSEAIRKLPDKERYVVSLYYFDELTMKEIGTVLNITESRVSQLHTKSMIRLRDALKSYVENKGR